MVIVGAKKRDSGEQADDSFERMKARGTLPWFCLEYACPDASAHPSGTVIRQHESGEHEGWLL